MARRFVQEGNAGVLLDQMGRKYVQKRTKGGRTKSSVQQLHLQK
jgi:hypothetical protein